MTAANRKAFRHVMSKPGSNYLRKKIITQKGPGNSGAFFI
jgi:hypothetical protein